MGVVINGCLNALNTVKCYLMRFYRSSDQLIYMYSINNIKLRSVSTITNLGITLTSHLNFRDHTECIVK